MWVPHKKKTKQRMKRKNKMEAGTIQKGRGGEKIIDFFSLYFIYHIYENMTVKFRRDKHEKCSTRGYQKHMISPKIQVKIWKNPNF